MKNLIFPVIVVLAYIAEGIGHMFGLCFHGLLASITGLSVLGQAGLVYHHFKKGCNHERCNHSSNEERDKSVLPVSPEPR